MNMHQKIDDDDDDNDFVFFIERALNFILPDHTLDK